VFDDSPIPASASLSVREAAEACNIAKDTAAACLKVLIERGFIRCAKLGSFNYKLSHPSEWELTAWPVGKELPTKDLMRWLPLQKKTRS